MGILMRVWALLLLGCLLPAPPVAGAVCPEGDVSDEAPQGSQGAEADGVTRLVQAIEYAIREGDDVALRALARPDASRARVSEFALSMTQTKVSEVRMKERDRAALVNGGQRLLLEILTV